MVRCARSASTYTRANRAICDASRRCAVCYLTTTPIPVEFDCRCLLWGELGSFWASLGVSEASLGGPGRHFGSFFGKEQILIGPHLTIHVVLIVEVVFWIKQAEGHVVDIDS